MTLNRTMTEDELLAVIGQLVQEGLVVVEGDADEPRVRPTARGLAYIASLVDAEAAAPLDAREFLVTKQMGEAWPGLPPAGQRFRITIAPCSPDATLETWCRTTRAFQPFGTMAIAALRRAVLDRAVMPMSPEVRI